MNMKIKPKAMDSIKEAFSMFKEIHTQLKTLSDNQFELMEKLNSIEAKLDGQLED